MKSSLTTTLALAALAAACGQAEGAEAFQLRYNIAGSLGGEMFGVPDRAGFAAGLAYTDIVIDKVTGDDGHALTSTLAGGSVPLPAPAPPRCIRPTARRPPSWRRAARSGSGTSRSAT